MSSTQNAFRRTKPNKFRSHPQFVPDAIARPLRRCLLVVVLCGAGIVLGLHVLPDETEHRYASAPPPLSVPIDGDTPHDALREADGVDAVDVAQLEETLAEASSDPPVEASSVDTESSPTSDGAAAAVALSNPRESEVPDVARTTVGAQSEDIPPTPPVDVPEARPATPPLEAALVLPAEASESASESIQLINLQGDETPPAYRFPALADYERLARDHNGLFLAWNPATRQGVRIGHRLELTVDSQAIDQATLTNLDYSRRMGRLPDDNSVRELIAQVETRFPSLVSASNIQGGAPSVVIVLALKRSTDNEILRAQQRWQRNNEHALLETHITTCRMSLNITDPRFEVIEVRDRFNEPVTGVASRDR